MIIHDFFLTELMSYLPTTILLNLSSTFRKFPYLDSSIIFGHKSDMLRLLPLDDMTKLQTFLSEQYLAGNEDIVVDVSGDIVSTINKDNYKSGTGFPKKQHCKLSTYCVSDQLNKF